MAAESDDFQKLLAYIAIGWTSVCVTLWFVLLSGPFSFHSKLTLWYSVDAGLWSVKLSHGVVTGAIHETLNDDAKAWVRKLVWREESISDFQDRMCAPFYRNAARVTGSNVCDIWIRFLQGTRVFMVLTVVGCILLIVGCAFTWRHYMFPLTRTKWRNCMKGFVLAGPLVITLGLLVYVMLTQNFADMPPRRVREFGANWGTCTGMACLLTMLSYGPMLLSFCCLTSSTGELFGNEEHERKKFPLAYAAPVGQPCGQATAFPQGSAAPYGTTAQYSRAANYATAAPASYQFQHGPRHVAQTQQGAW